MSFQYPQSPASPALVLETAVSDFGLRAQSRLSPYVMGFFGVGLPMFVWTARLGVPVWLLAGYLILFVAAWTVFMILKNQAEKLQALEPGNDEVRRQNVQKRLWRQSIGGAIWAVSLFLICLPAGLAGTDAQMFLTVCAGAAIGIIFFASPVLLHLLILGPIAVAGPMIAFYMQHEGPDVSRMMTGGLALAMAMGFILNRHMRDHYLLLHRQQEASAERELAREARMALMETLQREVQTSLSGLEQHLSQAHGLLVRAPAPRRHVETALNEVAHLQSILVTTVDNDVAAAGGIELDVQPLDIELLCRRVMDQHDHLTTGKDLSFTINLQSLPETGAALGDAHRALQVLSHLVSNALLYTPQGRVEIKVMPVDGFLRLEVVDSGPGLNDEELELAFHPHARVTRTSSGHSGAGLGLSLSRSLAELMGGRLGAQSTPDVGSKFWLDLPFDKAATAPQRPSEPEDAAPEELTDHCLRLLLLSNDSLRAAHLRNTLEGMGHKCLTTTSRDRAVTLARKAPVDACLISTGMFEDLDEPENRTRLETFLANLRATQSEAALKIMALIPTGDQAEDLQALGVRPLLLPQSRDSLARALATVRTTAA